MTAGHVMHTAIVARRIIDADPAGEVGQRRGPGPVRIVLMPDNYAAMMGRFVEDLIVPEPDCATEQLRGGNNKRLVPEQIVQARLDTPRTQRMKEDAFGIGRLVC